MDNQVSRALDKGQVLSMRFSHISGGAAHIVPKKEHRNRDAGGQQGFCRATNMKFLRGFRGKPVCKFCIVNADYAWSGKSLRERYFQ